MTEYWQLSLIKQYLGEAEGCCNSLVPFITWWRPLDHVINRRHVKQVGGPYDEEICKYHGWGEWRSYLFTAQSLYTVPDLVLWSFSLSWHRFQNQFHLSYYREVEQNSRGDRMWAELMWSRLGYPPPQGDMLAISPDFTYLQHGGILCPQWICRQCAGDSRRPIQSPSPSSSLPHSNFITFFYLLGTCCCVNFLSSLLK